jgi:hypothetical protein
MKNQTPTRIGYERGLNGSRLDSMLNCLDPGQGAFMKVSEQGRGRLVPENDRRLTKSREEAVPAPCLNAPWSLADPVSVLLEGLFEHLL